MFVISHKRPSCRCSLFFGCVIFCVDDVNESFKLIGNQICHDWGRNFEVR